MGSDPANVRTYRECDGDVGGGGRKPLPRTNIKNPLDELRAVRRVMRARDVEDEVPETLALAHEQASRVRYDRFVLTRPDLLLFRDLPLTRLSRKLGEAYCNSHGGAGGDFHFVLERWHVEAVAANLDTIIALAANPPLEHPKPYLTSGHGMMRAFLDHALGPAAACDPAVRDARCRGVLSIDLVIFAGFDQEVYRKTPFHLLLLCPKAPVRQAVLAYLVATYGLSA